MTHRFRIKICGKLIFSVFHVQSVNCLSTVMGKEAVSVMIQRVIMTMKDNASFAIIQMHSKMKNVKLVPTQKRLKISNASHVAKIKFKLFSRKMLKSLSLSL